MRLLRHSRTQERQHVRRPLAVPVLLVGGYDRFGEGGRDGEVAYVGIELEDVDIIDAFKTMRRVQFRDHAEDRHKAVVDKGDFEVVN